MEYFHRALIGAMGELGKEFETNTQVVANKIARGIGKQIGMELKDRGVINENMDPDLVVIRLLEEIKAGNIKQMTTPDGKIIQITECNLCPKKVGKYPLKETACPAPGIIKGVLNSLGMYFNTPFPELEPGAKCSILIKDTT